MEVEKLVFIDETWTSTSMTRRYGRAPRGKRCLHSAPHGRWETTTFVGALRRRQLTAPMVTDGPMDGEMFPAYVRQFLCPTLLPGDTVILDNLSSHQGGGSRASDHRGGSRRTFSATLLSGSEPHRKVLFQAQSAPPQSCQERYRGPLEGNRRIA